MTEKRAGLGRPRLEEEKKEFSHLETKIAGLGGVFPTDPSARELALLFYLARVEMQEKLNPPLMTEVNIGMGQLEASDPKGYKELMEVIPSIIELTPTGHVIETTGKVDVHSI